MEKISRTIAEIGKIDRDSMSAARRRLDSLTKPLGSLGRLEEIVETMAGIVRSEKPRLGRKVIFTCAADHGVTDEGVSAYPKEVTPAMVYNFLSGGAAINVLARHAGAEVIVVDMGVAHEFDERARAHPSFRSRPIAKGTKNMAKEPAMTRAEAVKAVEAGIALVEEEAAKGLAIVGTGDMGIGNTTAASAIACVLTGRSPAEIVGRGTGVDDAALAKKIDIVRKVLESNEFGSEDPAGILSNVGGFEIGAICGIILGCAQKRIPVVVDGFISSAGALLAHAFAPLSKEYMFAAHRSAERGHDIILAHIGLKPFIDLDMRLGEGTGAALGMTIIDAALKIQSEMATFAEAGVSERSGS